MKRDGFTRNYDSEVRKPWGPKRALFRSGGISPIKGVASEEHRDLLCHAPGRWPTWVAEVKMVQNKRGTGKRRVQFDLQAKARLVTTIFARGSINRQSGNKRGKKRPPVKITKEGGVCVIEKFKRGG